MKDPLLTAKEAAEYLSVSVLTLKKWRAVNRYDLAYVKIGSRVMYRQSELDRFIAAQTKRPVAL